MKDEGIEVGRCSWASKGDRAGNGRAGLTILQKKYVGSADLPFFMATWQLSLLAYVLETPSPSEVYPSGHYLN